MLDIKQILLVMFLVEFSPGRALSLSLSHTHTHTHTHVQMHAHVVRVMGFAKFSALLATIPYLSIV